MKVSADEIRKTLNAIETLLIDDNFTGAWGGYRILISQIDNMMLQSKPPSAILNPCSLCGAESKVDYSTTLTTTPPQFKGSCAECGNEDYFTRGHFS